MNKLVKLLSIFALATTISFWSCKGDQGEQGLQGPIGPQGTPGTNGTSGTSGTNGTNGKDGKDGNANVQSFLATVEADDWKEIDVTGIGNGVSSKYGAVKVENTLVTAEKFVMVFLKQGDEMLKALPILYTKDMDNSVERLDYAYQTGQVNLYYRMQSQLFGGTVNLKPNGVLKFEIVCTSKTVGAALQKSGVDMKNYKEVMNFLNTSL
jgi:hypothetical protein